MENSHFASTLVAAISRWRNIDQQSYVSTRGYIGAPQKITEISRIETKQKRNGVQYDRERSTFKETTGRKKSFYASWIIGWRYGSDNETHFNKGSKWMKKIENTWVIFDKNCFSSWTAEFTLQSSHLQG